MRLIPLLVLALWWSVSTSDRVRVWQDERALWASAVEHAPRKPRPWVNLGRQYVLLGYPTLADDAYTTAIRVAADRPPIERQTAIAVASLNQSRLHFDLTAWLANTQ